MHRQLPTLIENLFPQILSEKYAIKGTHGYRNVESDWDWVFFFNRTSFWQMSKKEQFLIRVEHFNYQNYVLNV